MITAWFRRETLQGKMVEFYDTARQDMLRENTRIKLFRMELSNRFLLLFFFFKYIQIIILNY